MLLASWENAQHLKTTTSISQTSKQNVSWVKPSPGRYKCNVDAFFCDTSNRVGIGMCIRDAEGAFVLARIEWFSPVVDVDIGEAIGLLKAMEWARDLHLLNIDFEVDSKVVVDNIYGKQIDVSDFSVIINNCVHLLCTDLINSYVSFIRRQTNKVAHSLAKAALLEASFRIHSNIPSCIEFSIIVSMTWQHDMTLGELKLNAHQL